MLTGASPWFETTIRCVSRLRGLGSERDISRIYNSGNYAFENPSQMLRIMHPSELRPCTPCVGPIVRLRTVSLAVTALADPS
jgi:hypothetical protein